MRNKKVTAMLSEPVLELLTAFVDGELSQRQRKAVMRVLERSSEARGMLRQMQENAHKLKKLPRHKVEPSLVEQVLQAIAEQKSQPKQPSKSRAGRRAWMPYLAATMAASLLMGVIGFAYWKAMIEPIDPLKDDSDKFVKVVPETKPEPKPSVESPPKKKKHPLLDGIVEGVALGVGAKPAEQVFVALFRDLRNEGKGIATGQFTQELNSDANRATVVQLDISVKNNGSALKYLGEVLRARNIKLVTDPAVGKTLADKNQAKVEYLVYAENLTTDDVTKLMSELGQPMNVGINNQKKAESPYQKVTVTPIAKNDKQNLARLLGVEPSVIEPKNVKDVKPDPKRERSAVLLPNSAGAAPSVEVRQFVKGRQPQPGTLQILIRIHQE